MDWTSARKAICIAAISTLLAAGCAMAQSHRASHAPLAAKPATASRVQDRTFQSAALGRPMTYRIVLPKDYAASARRYPVLYLLHGWNGSYKNWETLTNLTAYSKDLPLIVVMPDGENSWYVDSETVPADRFEQYLANDLTEDVDEHWRTLCSGHRRAIAGLSMGGYGALKTALKHPGMFAAALSLSGAFQAADPALESEEELKPSLQRAFGSANSRARRENDLLAILKNTSAAQAPYLFVSCGAGDRVFLPANRKLAAILSEQGFRYEYHETAGAHEWRYWDEQLPLILKVAQKILN